MSNFKSSANAKRRAARGFERLLLPFLFDQLEVEDLLL